MNILALAVRRGAFRNKSDSPGRNTPNQPAIRCKQRNKSKLGASNNRALLSMRTQRRRLVLCFDHTT